MNCIWLVAFCHGFKDDIKLNDTEYLIPFKEPYIEMYENLKDGIILGDFSQQNIIDFLGLTQSALSKDCYGECKNISKLKKIRNLLVKGAKTLIRDNLKKNTS